MRRKSNLEKLNIVQKTTRAVVIIVFVLTIVSVLRGVLRLANSGSRVRDAQVKLEEIKKEQQQLKDELNEVQSEYYKDKLARDKLGLAREGEVVVVLPEEGMLRRLSPRRAESVKKQLPEPNWKKWATLFFDI